jgi:hypothetical protein
LLSGRKIQNLKIMPIPKPNRTPAAPAAILPPDALETAALPALTPSGEVWPPPPPSAARPAAVTRTATLAAGATPDWLYHHLTISGSGEIAEEFAAAARGAGVTPWQLNTDAIEEDIFVRAVSQPASRRNLTVNGCRILARQFRERVEAGQARAAALVGRAQKCPFDLHALLPVPAAILMLGPSHPAALA